MTKQDLIIELSDRHLLPRDKVKDILNSIADINVSELVELGEITLQGLGKLKVIDRAARHGRNPSTGAMIEIPATRSVKFVVTKTLKEGLNA